MTSRVAEVLKKPEERINIVLSPGQRICRAGSYDPVVILQIHSIAVFDKDKNPPYFQPLFDFLTSELKVPEKRMTVQFIDLPAHMVENGK